MDSNSEGSLDSDLYLTNYSSDDENSTYDAIITRFQQCKVEEQQTEQVIDHKFQTKWQNDHIDIAVVSPQLLTSTGNIPSELLNIQQQNDCTSQCNTTVNIPCEILVQKRETREIATNTEGSFRYNNNKRHRQVKSSHRYNNRSHPYQHFHCNQMYQYSVKQFYPQHFTNYNNFIYNKAPHRFYNEWDYRAIQRQQHYREMWFNGFYHFSKFIDFLHNIRF